MTRTILLCSVICLLGIVDTSAQRLGENTTAQQVIGYRMVEQQRWNAQQLPKSSVLYKADGKYTRWQSQPFSLKKEKQPVINLSLIRPVAFQNHGLMNAPASRQLPFLRTTLFQQKQLYNQWQKESWLKELQGGMLLREFFIQ